MRLLVWALGLGMALSVQASSRNNMIVRNFGALTNGQNTVLYTLRARGGLIVEVSNYGGRIVRVYAPDKGGNLADVALGWNTAGEYEKYGACMGTLIGRFANRIANASFTLDGQTYKLPLNETSPAPRHCNLHSGPDGMDNKLWHVEPLRESRVEGLVMTCVSEDGEAGFPGKVTCKVTYRVYPNNILSLDYEATTDKPTVINLTHHGYWNMAGEASGNVLKQELQIFADEYTQTDAGLIPVRNASVAGTGFDFREPRLIDAWKDWMEKEPSLEASAHWYDHNFVLRGKVGELKRAVLMRDPVSGRTMEIFTTEPCLQLYGSQNFKGSRPVKAAGHSLVQYAGLALETQHFPDSPNHPEFPSTVLRPGETFKSRTEYRFTAE